MTQHHESMFANIQEQLTPKNELRRNELQCMCYIQIQGVTTKNIKSFYIIMCLPPLLVPRDTWKYCSLIVLALKLA
jgi:hypothetical protein